MLKRLFDVIFSFIGLIILSPLFLIIGILIKLDSKGPVFYKGERVGKDGKLFKIYKFRTMYADADKTGGGHSCADSDPRITKVGKILRKYKFNEMPQLINILKGEMSFVGPRPEVKFYTDMFTEEEKIILSVSPGLTDWASLWNLNEGELLAEVSSKGEDPERFYAEKIRPEKIRLQLQYVRNHSLWTDVIIFMETLKKCLLTRSKIDSA